MDQEQIEALRQALFEDVVQVKFVKVNGVVRDMNCTLSPKALPWMPNDELARNSSLRDTMVVWDVDAGEWRRFRNESVISWQKNSVQM